MKIGEWWFKSEEKNRKDLDRAEKRSATVLLEMARLSKLEALAQNGAGTYHFRHVKVKGNGEIWWEFQLEKIEPFHCVFTNESFPITEQLIIAHNWGKEASNG